MHRLTSPPKLPQNSGSRNLKTPITKHFRSRLNSHFSYTSWQRYAFKISAITKIITISFESLAGWHSTIIISNTSFAKSNKKKKTRNRDKSWQLIRNCTHSRAQLAAILLGIYRHDRPRNALDKKSNKILFLFDFFVKFRLYSLIFIFRQRSLY